MLGVCFICHGNICRSTMAESLFTNMVKRAGIADKFYITSAATHPDALGCPPHSGTRAKLAEEGVPLVAHHARLLTREDGDTCDFILAMDDENYISAQRLIAPTDRKKIKRLLDFTERPRAIADPWYTGDFDATYDDLVLGLNAFLAYLKETRQI